MGMVAKQPREPRLVPVGLGFQAALPPLPFALAAAHDTQAKMNLHFLLGKLTGKAESLLSQVQPCSPKFKVYVH